MARSTYVAALQTQLDSELAALKAERQRKGAQAAGASAAAAAGGLAAPPSPQAAAPRVKRRAGLWLVSAAAVVVLAIALGVLATAGLHTGALNPSGVPTATTTTATATAAPGATATATPAPAPTPIAPFFLPGALPLLVLVLVGLGIIVSLASASRRRRTAGPVLAGSGAATRPELLDLRIDRLEQLRRWMSEDPDLTRLVDSTIGRQVSASEARQRVFSAGVGVASLIVGWLLSVFNPLSLFR